MPFAYVQFNALLLNPNPNPNPNPNQVPMPFAYVQFNALLLNFFILLTPLSIACFTTTITMCTLTLV